MKTSILVRASLAEGLADVLIYLIRITDRLGELETAACEKLSANNQKYPPN